MHDYTCQVCGTRLETPAGPYAEAAHVRPLGRPHDGTDATENLLCLCPNCHVLFDLGAITVEDDGRVSSTGEPLHRVRGHVPDPAFLRYHREHIGGGGG